MSLKETRAKAKEEKTKNRVYKIQKNNIEMQGQNEKRFAKSQFALSAIHEKIDILDEVNDFAKNNNAWDEIASSKNAVIQSMAHTRQIVRKTATPEILESAKRDPANLPHLQRLAVLTNQIIKDITAIGSEFSIIAALHVGKVGSSSTTDEHFEALDIAMRYRDLILRYDTVVIDLQNDVLDVLAKILPEELTETLIENENG